jgi:hypothetical protein
VLWEGRVDVGAYPSGITFLSAATISNVGNDYTVTPNGATRFVIFFQNGIPHTTDASSPYTATVTSGTVTAKAYARYAQANAVFTATDAGGVYRLGRSSTVRAGTVRRP